jgi:hypothetical protein
VNDRLRTDGRRIAVPRSAAGLLTVLLLSVVLPFESGCRPPSSSSRPSSSGGPEAERSQRHEMFQYAMRPFFNYWEYDRPEIFEQAVDRLDQWAREQDPLDWELDPMVETLPKTLSELSKTLKVDQLEFPRTDSFALREAVWLRDVSNWARGDAVDELDQAKRLFDWTVRNIQIDPAPTIVLQEPWETLLLGRGTPTDRAWLFILLARQQRIDAALVALTNPVDPAARRVRPWAVAVLSQGQLYLFDANLGLPIPAANGIQRGPAGELEIHPATLAEVADDESLLKQLHAGSEHRYPVQSTDVQRVVILLEASPTYLAKRMKLVENQLVGDEQVVLTTDPSAQAERFKACSHVIDVRLWEVPYRTIGQERELGAERDKWREVQMFPFNIPFDVSPVARARSREGINGLEWGTVQGREAAQEAERAAREAGQANDGQAPIWAPALRRARLLHIKGELTGEKAAGFYYTKARIPDRDLNAPQVPPQAKKVLTWAKTNASYWLGLIAAHQGSSEAAVDWLKTRTLEAIPNGPWTSGARYNLGRVYEAQGQIDKAVESYRLNSGAPDRHGNLLRALWLQPPGSTESPESTESTEEPATEPAESPESRNPTRADSPTSREGL